MPDIAAYPEMYGYIPVECALTGFISGYVITLTGMQFSLPLESSTDIEDGLMAPPALTALIARTAR